MILDYETYESMGGSANSAAFARLEAKAAHIVHRATHGRIRGETPVREAVKMCVYELIESMNAAEQETGMSGREIVSMSNDGVSVTYAQGAGDGNINRQSRLTGILSEWLIDETDANGTPLLYAGVDA